MVMHGHAQQFIILTWKIKSHSLIGDKPGLPYKIHSKSSFYQSVTTVLKNLIMKFSVVLLAVALALVLIPGAEADGNGSKCRKDSQCDSNHCCGVWPFKRCRECCKDSHCPSTQLCKYEMIKYFSQNQHLIFLSETENVLINQSVLEDLSQLRLESSVRRTETAPVEDVVDRLGTGSVKNAA